MPVSVIENASLASGVPSSVSRSALPAGTVLQVIQTVKTDVFSTTSTSLIDVTGVSVSITPRSASNKVLINVQIYTGNSNTSDSNYFALFRDSTQIGGGVASGSRPSMFSSALLSDAASGQFAGGQFLDSPATTSAVTYKIQMRVSSGTGRVGATGNDLDTANRPRYATTITVMEIAG
jgi:hypothetical protein